MRLEYSAPNIPPKNFQPYHQRLREFRFSRGADGNLLQPYHLSACVNIGLPVNIGRGVNIGCDRCFYITFNNTFYQLVLLKDVLMRSFIKE